MRHGDGGTVCDYGVLPDTIVVCRHLGFPSDSAQAKTQNRRVMNLIILILEKARDPCGWCMPNDAIMKAPLGALSDATIVLGMRKIVLGMRLSLKVLV